MTQGIDLFFFFFVFKMAFTNISTLLSLVTLYTIGEINLVPYLRLVFLQPLIQIPPRGPKLVAATLWYEALPRSYIRRGKECLKNNGQLDFALDNQTIVPPIDEEPI